VASKNRLALIRSELSKLKELALRDGKILEKLEVKERELALLVPTLKE
jgi:hypothetical protein